VKGNRELDKAQIEKADAERKERERPAEGPVEEMVVAGTAFGAFAFFLPFIMSVTIPIHSRFPESVSYSLSRAEFGPALCCDDIPFIPLRC
jgi:hypothetical protein